MTASERHNARVTGTGERAMVFAHGFGCDQNMWRFVAPAFERDFRVVLFDHVGAGGSDLSRLRAREIRSLDGYAERRRRTLPRARRPRTACSSATR